MTRLNILTEKKSNTCANPPGINNVGVSQVPAILASQEFAGNVSLVTLGCAKNLVDSEVMLGVLKARGFRPVGDPVDADLIVVNTCAFLQSAVEEGIDTILDLAKLKQSGRCRELVVAGCMVERYREDLRKSLPEVDRFISTDELLKVAEVGSTTEDCFNNARRPYFIYDENMPRLRGTRGHTAFVKIAEGCDRPCTFCIIPKIRGAFRSRPINSIVGEVEGLIRDGVKEINFVAQDLTAYGSDFKHNGVIPSHLPELLSQIGKLSRNHDKFWLRLLYAYPIGVNEALIKQILESSVICKYLDLPLQHISHSVLKRMQRPLGERRTRELIEQIKMIAPDLALRTTFVVGFPGETEEDIESLREFIAAGYFTHVGVFSYSQEAEAKSYTYQGQVEEAVKEERRKLLMETQQKVVKDRLTGLIGQELTVLIEGTHGESELLLSARTEWQGPETDGEVIITEVVEGLLDTDQAFDPESLAGRFAKVIISDVAEYDLVGKMVSLDRV